MNLSIRRAGVCSIALAFALILGACSSSVEAGSERASEAGAADSVASDRTSNAEATGQAGTPNTRISSAATEDAKSNQIEDEPVDLGKATLTYPSRGAFSLLPVVASEQGFFARHGLDMTVEYVQPGPGSVTLAGGEIQFTLAAGHLAHTLSLGGAKVLEVATFINKPLVSLVAADGITEISQLVDKTIAVSIPTAIPTMIFRQLLEDNNIDFNTVAKRVIPANADQVPALLSGSVSGMIATKPLDILAQSQGANILTDLSQSDTDWPYISLLVNGEYAAGNDAAVVATVRSLLDAREWWITHPDEVKELIARESNTDNTDVINSSYELASELFLAEPYPTRELSQKMLDLLRQTDEFAGKIVDNTDPDQFISTHFVAEALR